MMNYLYVTGSLPIDITFLIVFFDNFWSTAFIIIYFQLETLKFTVERTATDLESMRKQANQLRQEVEEKKDR